jgi:phospholipid/cholesterol/gamma-HCH transport system substrate-binding protein
MNNRNFAVGIFVALGLAAFVSATLWLTGRQGSEPTVHYSMFFEKDVGGLLLGGPVFYLGVDVGTVTAMAIIPGNPMRVRVDAEVLKSAPIDAGTYASLAFQGITGVAVIKLSADPGVHAPLTAGEESKYPVIPVRDAGFSAILAKAPGVVDRIDSVLMLIEEILGEENRTYVSNMLADFSKVTGALAAKEETIGELPVLLKQSIEELQATLEQIRSLAGNLEPDMSATLANLEKTTRNLAAMTERMELWTANSDSDMNEFLGSGLGQVPALVSDARATLREIDKLVKDLRENPSTLVYKPVEKAVEVEQ